MTAYEEFNYQFNELRRAFEANSTDPVAVYAKMVGCLSVIVPFNADDRSLRKMAADMEQTVKRELMTTLKGEETA